VPLATGLTLTLPSWFGPVADGLPAVVPAVEDRVGLVIELAGWNVAARSGGPFAAAVFERDSGRLVSVGVNQVVPSGLSCAHAEFVAISLAQVRLGTWDLGGPDLPAHQLVVSWAPCVMCFGSVLWSGVVDLVLAGAGPELEAITGFDEGPMPARWEGELAVRGITLRVGIRRDEAVAVFRAYADSGEPVYNGRRGSGRAPT
jgi:tRNA(Arg) A34 adenosine deaminase TadA